MKRYYVRAAFIAAVYAVVTIALAPISYGPVQVRVAEALTLLPVLWPEAVPGLFLGCLLANVLGGLGLWDIGLGSLATLIAALLTRRCRTPWLGGVWPVVANGLIVGSYLSVLFHCSWTFAAGYVALGEAIAVYGLGVPLVRLLAHREARTDGDSAHAHSGDSRRAVQPTQGPPAG